MDRLDLSKAKVIIKKEPFEFHGYEFDKEFLSKTPFSLLMLLFCIDPTPLQKELLNELDVVFEDNNKKIVFPKKEEEKKEEENG